MHPREGSLRQHLCVERTVSLAGTGPLVDQRLRVANQVLGRQQPGKQDSDGDHGLTLVLVWHRATKGCPGRPSQGRSHASDRVRRDVLQEGHTVPTVANVHRSKALALALNLQSQQLALALAAVNRGGGHGAGAGVDPNVDRFKIVSCIEQLPFGAAEGWECRQAALGLRLLKQRRGQRHGKHGPGDQGRRVARCASMRWAFDAPTAGSARYQRPPSEIFRLRSHRVIITALRSFMAVASSNQPVIRSVGGGRLGGQRVQFSD